MQHNLKTWPAQFHDVKYGLKRFEIRKNDRDYQVGNLLLLQELNPDTRIYSGDECLVVVDYVMTEFPCHAVLDGFAVMSIGKVGK